MPTLIERKTAAPANRLTVGVPRLRRGGDRLDVEARFSIGAETTPVRFRITGLDGGSPPLAGEAMLALGLVPAMRRGLPLHLATPIDRSLLDGCARFQTIFSQWFPEFQRVAIEAQPAAPAAPAGRGVGVFFSGGVDSFYSLLKHHGEITHAIFVHGVDIDIDNTSHRELVSQHLRRACDEIGVRLVEVETDLRAFSDPHCHWGYHYHGPALAAVAMLLSGCISKIYLASSETYATMEPWGSTLITDPLWSTAALTVINDGAESYRHEKTARLARNASALRHLRVCWENVDGDYNCGRCEKCYRTMVALRLAGALERCDAFATPLHLDAMTASPQIYKDPHTRQFWREMHRAAAGSHDTDLVAALAEVARRSDYIEAVREFARVNRDLLASPQWRRLLPRIHNKLFDSIRNHDPDWFVLRVMKSLPENRDLAFERLWHSERKWLQRRLRQASRQRRLAKLRRLLFGKRRG